MKLRLDIIGDPTHPSVNVLIRWVHDEPGFSIEVTRTLGIPQPDSGVSLTVGLTTPSNTVRLAAVLARWLHSQTGAATIRITAPDGTTVRAWAGTEVGQLSRLLDALVDAGAGAVDERGDLAHQMRELVEAEPGVVQVRYQFSALSAFGPDGRVRTTRRDEGEDRPTDYENVDISAVPVVIYLADEGIHEQVEAAVEELMATAGLEIERRDNPIVGSWYRKMWASVTQVVRSPVAREGALIAAHAADTRLVLAQDAVVTATLLQNLGPVIVSLQPTKDAVLRVGALLIVKVDWVVNVHQLTAAQQVLLDHRPGLIASPHEILAALNLPPSGESSGTPAVQ